MLLSASAFRVEKRFVGFGRHDQESLCVCMCREAGDLFSVITTIRLHNYRSSLLPVITLERRF